MFEEVVENIKDVLNHYNYYYFIYFVVNYDIDIVYVVSEENDLQTSIKQGNENVQVVMR